MGAGAGGVLRGESHRLGALCGRRSQLEQETVVGGDGVASNGRGGTVEDNGARG